MDRDFLNHESVTVCMCKPPGSEVRYSECSRSTSSLGHLYGRNRGTSTGRSTLSRPCRMGDSAKPRTYCCLQRVPRNTKEGRLSQTLNSTTSKICLSGELVQSLLHFSLSVVRSDEYGHILHPRRDEAREEPFARSKFKSLLKNLLI